MAYLEEKQFDKALGYLSKFVDAAMALSKHPHYGDLTLEFKEKLCRQTIFAVKLAKKLKNTQTLLNSDCKNYVENKKTISTAEKLKVDILSSYCEEENMNKTRQRS
uniref:USP8_dimer domain-containing protein n=1 Tax=Panagrellus redivivus TaxID=6233 RepID=A0A7E4W859_PANRE